MGTWNWLDWILATVVVASIVTAVVKGFVRELLSIAAVILGLGVAALGYTRAASWFEDLTKSHEVALGLGFLVLFSGILIVGAIVSHFTRRLIQAAGVQWIDRFLGAIFGLLRGVLLDCILLLVLVSFAIKTDALQQSFLAPYVATGTRVIAMAMPASLKTHFEAGFDKFKQALTQRDKKTSDK